VNDIPGTVAGRLYR